jgi:hypothetical protein
MRADKLANELGNLEPRIELPEEQWCEIELARVLVTCLPFRVMGGPLCLFLSSLRTLNWSRICALIAEQAGE